jgi:restriction system protein
MGLEARFKGWTGELKTRFVNSLSLGAEYKVFNNVIIRTKRGSTQIDHVIVSPYGLFAVETKDKTGWIFGDANRELWTGVIFKKRYSFPNPLRQNYAHTKSLSEYLGVGHEKIHSLVIFWGDCEFKTPMPDNVCKGGILNKRFRDYIQGKKQLLLSPEMIDSVCAKLKAAKKESGFFGSLRHVSDVKERYRSTTKCPKCGGDLVRKVATEGQGKGIAFLGCSNYPRCKYIKR